MSDGMRRELMYLSSYATNRYFIPNWGKLLDSYLNNEKCGNLKDKDLTDAQLKEWKEIGKKVFSWTCCSMRKA